MNNDTDPLVQNQLDRIFAKMSLSERAVRYFTLWESNRAMLREGIRQRFPKATPEEIEKRFRDMLQHSWSEER